MPNEHFYFEVGKPGRRFVFELQDAAKIARARANTTRCPIERMKAMNKATSTATSLRAIAGFALAMMSVGPASAVEAFESPGLPAGTAASILPAGWSPFGSTTYNTINPTGTGLFSNSEPLSAPAGGNQALQLSGENSGVYYMTGIAIQTGQAYSVQAAIGTAISATPSAFWSMQLWADKNATGAF
jgi:hypothetical protein